MLDILYNKYKDIISSLGMDCGIWSANRLWEISRDFKERLSKNNIETKLYFEINKPVNVSITRQEFEEATKTPLMNTIMATCNFWDAHQNQRPDIILLTGEASQMPMVRREMEKMIPEYGVRIISYRPSSAIAYGAARYGTLEMDMESKEV